MQKYFRELSCSTHRFIGMWGGRSAWGQNRTRETPGPCRTSARSPVPRAGPGGEGCSSPPVPERSPVSGTAEGGLRTPGFCRGGGRAARESAGRSRLQGRAAPAPKPRHLFVSVKSVLPLGTSPAERARSAAARGGVKRFAARTASPAAGRGAPTGGSGTRSTGSCRRAPPGHPRAFHANRTQPPAGGPRGSPTAGFARPGPSVPGRSGGRGSARGRAAGRGRVGALARRDPPLSF